MTLFFQKNDSVFLHKGDSLSLIKDFPDKSFDMIFADPPYFLSNNGITCRSGEMVSVNKGGWDKSTGLLAEVELAESLNIKITYLDK